MSSAWHISARKCSKCQGSRSAKAGFVLLFSTLRYYLLPGKSWLAFIVAAYIDLKEIPGHPHLVGTTERNVDVPEFLGA